MTTTHHHPHRAATPCSTAAKPLAGHALTLLAACAALLAAGIASAAKPTPPAECTLLLAPAPQYVYTGTPFVVKVVRDPSYPGAFRQPTVSIDVTYPMRSGTELTQNYTVTIPSFYVPYVEADFVAPRAQGDAGEVAIGEDVLLRASVSEPLLSTNGKRQEYNTTVCTTTATVLQAS